jgi:hypothetical protein
MIYHLTDEDHQKILNSPHHHFLHLVMQRKYRDGSWLMAMSNHAMNMLQKDLGLKPLRKYSSLTTELANQTISSLPTFEHAGHRFHSNWNGKDLTTRTKFND